MAEAVQRPAGRRRSRNFILGSLSFGHGISHLYDQGIPVFLPAIKAAMGLSNFEIAFLLGIRQGGSGAVHLIGGALRDHVRVSHLSQHPQHGQGVFRKRGRLWMTGYFRGTLACLVIGVRAVGDLPFAPI